MNINELLFLRFIFVQNLVQNGSVLIDDSAFNNKNCV